MKTSGDWLPRPLEMEHNTVFQAMGGQQALQLLGEYRVDVTLLDMKMPVMDGWSFAHEYRARPGTARAKCGHDRRGR
jgi:CheY-like chemotaxis protein